MPVGHCIDNPIGRQQPKHQWCEHRVAVLSAGESTARVMGVKHAECIAAFLPQ